MTTAQIESLANSSGTATPDFPLQAMFRNVVIPKFLLDLDGVIGRVSWRRVRWSQAVTAALREYELPDDFSHFEEIGYVSTDDPNVVAPLTYIGEDAAAVAAAEAATDQDEPSGYYLTREETDITHLGVMSLVLNVPPESAFTLRGTYIRLIPFVDDTTEVDLDLYIPKQSQFPLVHLLKAEILNDRYSKGDQRFSTEMQKYEQAILSFISRKEPGPRNKAVFAR
jgi:hypothetical protein